MVEYQTPINDPWFSAHQQVQNDTDGLPVYNADNNPSPLACKTQHQYCDPNVRGTKRCTALASWDQTFDSYDRQYKNLSNMQYGALDRILHAAYESTIEQITLALDTDTLLASMQVADDEGFNLVDDQWKNEVVHMSDIQLAYLQSLMVSFVTG